MGNQSSSRATLDELKSDLVAYEAETGTRHIEARRRLNELSRMQGGGMKEQQRMRRIYDILEDDEKSPRTRDIIKSQLKYGRRSDEDIIRMIVPYDEADDAIKRHRENELDAEEEADLPEGWSVRIRENGRPTLFDPPQRTTRKDAEKALAVGLPEGWSVRIREDGRPIYTGFGKSSRKRPQSPQRTTFKDDTKPKPNAAKRSSEKRCKDKEICSGCTKSVCMSPPCSWDTQTGKCKGKARTMKNPRKGCKNQTSEEECSSSSSSSSSSKCEWYKEKCHTKKRVKTLKDRVETLKYRAKSRKTKRDFQQSLNLPTSNKQQKYKTCKEKCKEKCKQLK